MKLQARFTLAVTAVVALVITLAGLIVVQRIDHRDRADLDRLLATRADAISAAAARTGTLDADGGYVIRLVDRDRLEKQVGSTVAFPLTTRTGYATISAGGGQWRSLVRPLVSGAVLQVLQSLDDVRQRRAANARTVAVVGLISVLLAAAAVWFVAGLLLQPLHRLRAGAAALRSDDPEQRLPAEPGPPEVADLAVTLNALLDRLQADAVAADRFAAVAGPGLRAPLIDLGTGLETLLRDPGLPVTQRHLILAGMADDYRRITALLDEAERDAGRSRS
jgi:two-component system sensor histidine kinase PrrB